jgi:iron complex transport system substrate-binding protein
MTLTGPSRSTGAWLLVFLVPLAAAAADPPQRVVTLAPNLTELVYAAGAGERLVGTVAYSDYPREAKSLPVVGDAVHLDAEKLLSLQPDLIVAWRDGMAEAELKLLEGLGVPFLSVPTAHLSDVSSALLELGRRFHTEPIAQAAAARFDGAIATLRVAHRGQPRLRAFYQIWDAPLYTLGGRHVVTELLDLCAADNVYADVRQSAFVVALESVYARDPDVLVLAGSQREVEVWRLAWRARPPLPAVERGALVALDPDLANRLGPRLAEGARALCEGLDRLRAAAGGAAHAGPNRSGSVFGG